MIKGKKAVIFDMDGVLVDSEDAMKVTSMESLERFGIHPEKGDFLEFTGMGEDAFIGGVARKYGLEYDSEMKEYAYKRYVEEAEDLVYVFPEAKDVILKTRGKGMKIAVASAADMVKVRANLECIGVAEDLFDALVTGDDVTRNKPDPEIFQKAAKKLGVDPEDCIVIEDAISGLQAAKKAGMTSIGVTSAFSREEITEGTPDHVADSLAEAYEIIFG